jgi:5-methylcytosine-specific restriction endonuclease McrA
VKPSTPPWTRTRPSPDSREDALRILRPQVKARDGYRCVVCDEPASDGEVHHRQGRGRGGRDTSDNLILLCKSCHRGVTSPTGAHHAWALARGYLVPSSQQPTAVPILWHGTTWMLLGEDGSAVPCEQPGDVA